MHSRTCAKRRDWSIVQVFHADQLRLELPPGHRFPISKYGRLIARLSERQDENLTLAAAPPISREALNATHCPRFVQRVFEGKLSAAELRRLGLPWSPALVARSQRSVGATVAAMQAAIGDGVSVSLAGGTHHAGYDYAAGFCVFNDVAVAMRTSFEQHAKRRFLIVDCDVHQGDGNARLLADVDGAFTFSLHAARNYPHHKAVSDLDIGLPDRATDATYLDYLARGLEHAYRVASPQVTVFIAGADVYAGDRLGRLNLSADAIAARDEMVISVAEQHDQSVVVVMGGGYADDIDETVGIQAATVMVALASWQRRQAERTSR